MQYKYKNLKEKKSILYFNNLNFQKENYNILKSKFRVLKINNVKNKDFSKIVSIILPMNNFYSDKFFSKFPKLRSVVSPSTGDIHLDKKYLKDKKIRILNLSKFKRKLNFITSTSELTIGLILNCTRRISKIHENFVNDRIFKKYNFLLSNKIFTLGIVGMGRIGQHVANRAKALGFNVIYFDPNINTKKFTKEKSFEKFIKKTNILTIHMHFKKKFYGKYNNKIFKNLKKPSFIINTSRGEFINENDLINCLKKKIVNGAGLDVVVNEHTRKFRENPLSNKLINFYNKSKNTNLFITPKQGGSNKSAWAYTEKLLINELVKYEKNRI